MICFVLPLLKKKKKIILNRKKTHRAKEGAGSSSQEFGGRFVSQGIKKSSPCHERKSSSASKYPAEMAMGKGRQIQKKNPGCGTTTGAASKPVPAAHGAELGTLKKKKKDFLKKKKSS